MRRLLALSLLLVSMIVSPVTAGAQPEMWWYDIGTGSVCWRADLARERFGVDFDGDHKTFALTSNVISHPDYGDCADLGVCKALDATWRYGWAFRIGELRVDGPTAHINQTYVGDVTEWFYYRVPKTTAPTDWVVCLQGSDGINPIEVRDTFWYSVDGGWTWNEFTPPSSLDVTVKAHCNTEGSDVSVDIGMDGSPTGYATPHTFTELTAIHTFSVPGIDPYGSPFRCWSTGETTTSIAVKTSGTYTAYYNADAHDVAVTNVTASETVVVQGDSLSIDVTVENQGAFPETFGVVAPYFDGVVIPTSEQWDTLWSMGDVNRDGYIDDTDVELILAAAGSDPYDPSWNPDADLNQDGWVTMLGDGLICLGNQGLDVWTYFGLPLPPIGTQRGIKLYPCSQSTLTLTWNTAGVAPGDYVISAYAHPVPGETDTTDNTLIDGTTTIGCTPPFTVLPGLEGLDTDCDAARDVLEVGPDPFLCGTRDPNDPWDFYDVPVPTIHSGGDMNNRDSAVTLFNDVLGVLEYSGALEGGGPNGAGRNYDDDIDADTVKDGIAFDREVGAPWPELGVGKTHTAAPNPSPNGAVTLFVDVLLVLDQAGHICP